MAESSPGVALIEQGFSKPPEAGKRLLVQVIGSKGAGKTSYLLHGREQTGGCYCYYPPGLGRWKIPVVETIAYWDEADRIPKLLLLLSLGRARSLAQLLLLELMQI